MTGGSRNVYNFKKRKMNKYVIYTSLTGGYDNLIQLSCVSDEFDYICFTDAVSEQTQNGIWSLRPIPYNTSDKQRLSRYPKMHPHVLLPEYECSIYIDASIDIINHDLYKIIKEKIQNRVVLSGVKHPERDCAYDEYFAVYSHLKDTNFKLLKTEYRLLLNTGFPEHFGQFEAGMILRFHKDERIIRQCEDWWHMVNLYSRRDQLCYTYTLWKNKVPVDYLEGVGLNRPNPYCKICSHPRKKQSYFKMKKSAFYWHCMYPLFLKIEWVFKIMIRI